MSAANRRVSLGPLNASQLNTRRNSLEPNPMSKPPRPSMGGMLAGGALASLGASKRASLSSSGNGAAGAGGRRSSSTPRASSISTNRMVDPRPVSDKGFMGGSIRQILDFLAAHSYDQPINAKILSKPSTKDYQSLVLFLFRCIDLNYVCTGKIEDEILTMFKFLGYPFTLNKSHLSSVGSPHSWPQLLASITWLVELLSYDDAVIAAQQCEASEPDGEDATPQGLERAFYRYLHKSYGYFFAGKDTQFKVVEEQYLVAHQHRANLLADARDAVEQQNVAIQNEIDAIKQRSAHLPELNSRKTELLRTVSVLQETVSNKKRECEEVTHRIAAKSADLLTLQSNIATVKKEIHKVRDILSKQEISADDVQNMTAERARLEETYAQLSEMRVNLNKEVYRLEIVLRDNLAYLESTVRSYHGIAEDLKLIPISNKNARGEDYSISVDLKAKRRDQLLATPVKQRLVPLLEDVKRELQQMSLELRQDLMEEAERLEVQDLERTQLLESVQEMETKRVFLEDVYAKEKEVFDHNLALNNKERFALEHKLISLKDMLEEENRVVGMTRRLSELQSLRQLYASEHASKKSDMLEQIIEVVSLCAAHREDVQNGLDQLKTGYALTLQKLLSKEDMAGLLVHCNTLNALPLPVPPPSLPVTVPSAQEDTFRLRMRESLGFGIGEEEHDFVRVEDDALVDASLLSAADQSALHAMMHGL